MSKTAAPTPPRSDAAEVRQQLAGKHVCPFCGVMRADAGQPCPRCTLDDTSATRQATRQRVGPWFVLQARNPSAPGMKLATLQTLVRRGHVTPRSVVRGPSTDQLWAFAAGVRGLSRDFGLCFHCQESIDPAAAQCPHCGRGQDLVGDPDAMVESSNAAVNTAANAGAVIDVSTSASASAVPPPFGAPEPLVFSSLSSADTGMDGGTSLDLQADPHPPAARPTPRTLPPRPAPEPRPASQRPAARPAEQPSVVDRRPPDRTSDRPTNPPEDRPAFDRAAFDRPSVDRSAFDRPASARPPVPTAIQRVSPKEETILTARELAAAFQLDFKQPPANGRGRTAARPVRTLAGLLLIAALASAVVLGLRADWRQQAFAWASDRWGRVAASLEQPSAPHDRATTPAKPPAAGSAGTPSSAFPPPVAPSSVAPSSVAPSSVAPSSVPPAPVAPPAAASAGSPPVTVANVPPPAPSSVATSSADAGPPGPPGSPRAPAPGSSGAAAAIPPSTPLRETPAARPQPTPPVVRRPAPAAPPAAVPPVGTEDLTIDQATTLASDLRNRGIDAEARKDWAGAVAVYEQIQRLPRDAWPADLPMRLDVARRRAAQ